ncbi:MAG: hypothetical protein ACJAYU_002599 [Bradymonadia bacterium]
MLPAALEAERPRPSISFNGSFASKSPSFLRLRPCSSWAGFDAAGGVESADATQEAIYRRQCSLEAIFAAQNPDLTLVCDRGTLDGVDYWPADEAAFSDRMDSTIQPELSRYDAVIFFETGAGSNGDITSNNPIRNETNHEAIEFDRRLQDMWSPHANYHFVHSSDSFLEKIERGVERGVEVLSAALYE